ncbi:MAG: hypothetical protein WC964_00095 [Acholeplasmataceae bacterium]
MKKLFEKPLIHFTLVLTIIALACGFVVGITYEITHPIIMENQRLAQLEAYERVMPGIKDIVELKPTQPVQSVSSSIKALDKDNKEIGYVYVVNGTNGYGNMTIVISVNMNGIIQSSEFTVMNQTLNQDATRANLARYNGTPITDLEEPIGIIGGATVSFGTVKSMLADVAKVHVQVAEDVTEPDPYEDWFGEGYQLEEKVDLTGEYLQAKQVVKNSNGDIIGSIYVVEGKSVYHSSSEGTIRMHVGLDNDGKVIGYHFEVYEHTNGFRPDVVAYLNAEVLNTNINDFEEDEGISTGATNSSRLVIRMLTELKSEVTSV